MEFPTLFPMSIAYRLQQRLRTIHLHKYGLHLLKHCDHRFAKHPRFRYFLLNMIMRHRRQGKMFVFVKKTLNMSYL